METMGQRVAIAQGVSAPALVLAPDNGDNDDNDDNDDPFAGIDEGQLAVSLGEELPVPNLAQCNASAAGHGQQAVWQKGL